MLPEPCDDYWPIVTEGHQQGLIDHFAQTLTANLWKAASRFFESAGLERGVDLSVPKSLLKRFQDEGRHSDYGLLSAVCVGDLWPAARRSAQGMLSDPTCPRCGKAPETLTHRHWQCEANSLILEPEVVSTQSLCERAMSESETTPCFWNRGTVPMEWTVLPTPRKLSLCLGMVIGAASKTPQCCTRTLQEEITTKTNVCDEWAGQLQLFPQVQCLTSWLRNVALCLELNSRSVEASSLPLLRH